MNTRQLILILMAINIGLLGTIGFMVYWFRSYGPVVLDSQHSQRPILVDNVVTQISVKKLNATNLLSELANLKLGWASLESPNYLIYIRNLRQFGCPEETVRDIIIADIAKSYAQRKASLRTQAEPFLFWRTSREGTLPQADPDLAAQLRELDREMRQLIADLLSAEYDLEVLKFFPRHKGPAEDFLSTLPLEKQSRVHLILAEFEAREAELKEQSGGVLLSDEEEVLNQLLLDRQDALADVLSAEELLEYEMSISSLARSMRSELYGFEPSRNEFLDIYRIRSTYEEVVTAGLDGNTDVLPELREAALLEAETEFNAELKEALGDARYEQYTRNIDPDFQVALRLTERLELPVSVAQEVYNMKQTAQQSKQQIQENPALSQEQRLEALKAMADEARQSLANVMGEDVFQQYEQVGANWIDDIAFLPADPDILEPPDPPNP